MTSKSPRKVGRLRLLVGAFLSLLVGATLALAIGFFVFVGWLDTYESDPPAQGPADGIVALTGGSQRITDAIDLLAKGYGSRLLITGVNEKTSREEIARLNPGQRRLFECCVDLDYRARNTIGNAIETRRWMFERSFESLIVVTSNYHMPRTLLELEHVLPNVRKLPYAVAPTSLEMSEWWREPTAMRLLISEYAKFLLVWLRTRVESDPEGSAAAMVMSRFQNPVRASLEPFAR